MKGVFLHFRFVLSTTSTSSLPQLFPLHFEHLSAYTQKCQRYSPIYWQLNARVLCLQEAALSFTFSSSLKGSLIRDTEKRHSRTCTCSQFRRKNMERYATRKQKIDVKSLFQLQRTFGLKHHGTGNSINSQVVEALPLSFKHVNYFPFITCLFCLLILILLSPIKRPPYFKRLTSIKARFRHPTIMSRTQFKLTPTQIISTG